MFKKVAENMRDSEMKTSRNEKYRTWNVNILYEINRISDSADRGQWTCRLLMDSIQNDVQKEKRLKMIELGIHDLWDNRSSQISNKSDTYK